MNDKDLIICEEKGKEIICRPIDGHIIELVHGAIYEEDYDYYHTNNIENVTRDTIGSLMFEMSAQEAMTKLGCKHIILKPNDTIDTT